MMETFVSGPLVLHGPQFRLIHHHPTFGDTPITLPYSVKTNGGRSGSRVDIFLKLIP